MKSSIMTAFDRLLNLSVYQRFAGAVLVLAALDFIFSLKWTVLTAFVAFSAVTVFLLSTTILKLKMAKKKPKSEGLLSVNEMESILSNLKTHIEDDLVTTLDSEEKPVKQAYPFDSIVFLPVAGKKAFILPSPHQDDMVSKSLDAERTKRFLSQNGYDFQQLKTVSNRPIAGSMPTTTWPADQASLMLEFPHNAFNFN